jgi:hypothetical protein
MTIIRLNGWQVGMRKISLTKFLQIEAGLRVDQAKGIVDDILEGRAVELKVPAGRNANEMADGIRELGAICEVELE